MRGKTAATIPNKVALLITQTGGGLPRLQLYPSAAQGAAQGGLRLYPVISVSFGVEKNPGFKLSLSLIRKLAYAMLYGDVIVTWQTRSGPTKSTPARPTP